MAEGRYGGSQSMEFLFVSSVYRCYKSSLQEDSEVKTSLSLSLSLSSARTHARARARTHTHTHTHTCAFVLYEWRLYITTHVTNIHL
jgi:hypothetical protein